MSRDSTTFVSHLAQINDPVEVWNVNTDLIRLTWSIVQCNIGMRDGYPFGWIQYVNPVTEESKVVAVRWNQLTGQLQCSAAEHSERPDEFLELERDARLRVGSLLAAYAQLGSIVARRPGAQMDLRSSAGLPEAQGA